MYLVDFINIYTQVTLSKGDYPQYCGWVSSNQLKALEAKKREGIMPSAHDYNIEVLPEVSSLVAYPTSIQILDL